ncbi:MULTISPECIES: MFS transporter [Streptosporangium]|uniref:MFS family permease n=1 Tax=Streptosporangium brasiliense TaxID=47480 RepID=A0ABT9RFT4_9ACTN|nr:MFS transporter [Streptosporangium brasiliense]MDP9867205.1 MFS family permease [Streptosporangium brasiliense]
MSRRYRLGGYLAGALAARTGDEISSPALLLLGLSVTGSATAASSLLAGLTISSAVGGPVFGALLDRSPRPGRLLACALAAYAAALLVILLALGHTPVVQLVGVAVLAGLLGPALAGGWTAQLPLVVTGRDIRRGSMLDGLTYNLASLTGPALAGVLATAAGAPAAVVVSVVLVLLAAPAAWLLPARPVREGGRPLRRDLAAGFAAIARIAGLRRATVTTMVSFAGVGMMVVCAPLLGVRLTGEAGHGALLLSALAASALTANVVMARRPPAVPDRVLLISTLLLAAGSALAAVAGSPAVAVAAAVVAGLGQGPQLTAVLAVRHREAPEHLRGQIFTTAASLKISSFAVGSAIAGPLATWSLPGALFTAAGIQLLAALTYLLTARPSGQQLPPDRPHGLLVGPAGAAAGQPE